MRIVDMPHSWVTDSLPVTNPNTIVVHAVAEFIDFRHRDQTGWEFIDSLGWGAHYYITPSGTIINSIPEQRMGAHAKGHNEDTIGIEFVVPGLHTIETLTRAMDNPGWMSYAQTEHGILLCNELISRHKNIKYMTSHAHLSPERKTDPGKGFPYPEFIEKVNLKEEHINF